MRNGYDHQDESSNVVSLAGARKQAKAAAGASAARADRSERRTMGQWVTSAFLVMLGIGGVFALAAPLLRAAGIVGG